MPINAEAKKIFDKLNHDDYALMEKLIDDARGYLHTASITAAGLALGGGGIPPTTPLGNAMFSLRHAETLAHAINARINLEWKLRNIDANPTEGQ